MQPFSIYAEGTRGELETKLADAASAVIEAHALDEADADDLHSLVLEVSDSGLVDCLGDGVTRYGVSVTALADPAASTGGGLYSATVNVLAIERQAAAPSDGETPGQVDPTAVGTPDSPPATPDQH